MVSSVSVTSASSDKQVSKTQEPPKILLPEDLFAIAFSYLPLNDIMAASLVSRYINKCIPACTEIQIPEQMSVESGLLTSRLAEKFPLLKSLTFDNCKGLTNETLADMVARLPDLRYLDMKQVNGRDLPAILVAQGWAARLEGLRLSGVLFLRRQTLDTLIQSFSVSLINIKLGGVRTMEDIHVAALAEQCPNIRKADFDGCSRLKNVQLNMKKVEDLSFSHCVNLNSLTLGSVCGNEMNTLQKLNLCNQRDVFTLGCGGCCVPRRPHRACVFTLRCGCCCAAQ